MFDRITGRVHTKNTCQKRHRTVMGQAAGCGMEASEEEERMSKDYYSLISRIKADEALKEKLIVNLREKQKQKQGQHAVKGVFMKMKVRKMAAAAAVALGLITCGGAALAALKGSFGVGVSSLQSVGIKLPDDAAEWAEPVENQEIGNEDLKVALESSFCDDGFAILQFKVKVGEEKLKSYKDSMDSDYEVPLCYLSFNDPVTTQNGYAETRLGGANYNLVVDGEEVWVRGRSEHSIECVKDGEYIVHQMWFLDDSILNGKKEFTIALNDVVVGLDNDCIPVDGSFEVKLSKENALDHTDVIMPSKDASAQYKKVEKTIEKVSVTPLQNIIVIKSVYKDVDNEDLGYVLDEDYVGTLYYMAYGKDGDNISCHEMETERKITYKDGTSEVLEPGDYSFCQKEFDHAQLETTEVIAVEKTEDNSEVLLKVYEKNDYTAAIKVIMECSIDLDKKDVGVESKDTYIYNPEESLVTDEYREMMKQRYGLEMEMGN